MGTNDASDEAEWYNARVPEPTTEGQLLGSSDDWHRNAYLYAGSWDAYAESYKRAADQLVDDVVNGRAIRAEVDFLALPTIFLYRQYLELRLKELAQAGSQYCEVPTPNIITHNLITLWRSVRPLLENVFGHSDHYDIIEGRLQEFNAVDPGSDAFRYPENRSGQPSLAANENVDLGQMRDIIAGISSILDGASIGLYENQGAKSEMYSEMFAEMHEQYRSEMGE